MAGLKPQLAEEEHGFATIAHGQGWPRGLVPVATFAEDEGASVIAKTAMLEAVGLDHDGGWAKISLGYASSLDGVGLTARFSQALTEAGIPCNVVAAFHHDHLFVPWSRRQDAMAILSELEAPE
ncbi:MAG: ACT domain-containing protein [Sphingomonas sp.]|nr:ACT domain-containing protein [Sphingomonas sp.]